MTGGRIASKATPATGSAARCMGARSTSRAMPAIWSARPTAAANDGMTDGTILIGGDVGSEIGAAMRRGTLAVGGSCGDAAGFGMIAGTILVFGDLRDPHRCRHAPGHDRTLRRRSARACCRRSGGPAASARCFSGCSSASWRRLGFRPADGLLDERAGALPWRSRRPGQGRGLDESG